MTLSGSINIAGMQTIAMEFLMLTEGNCSPMERDDWWLCIEKYWVSLMEMGCMEII
jgi:hypothetical protein